MQKEVILPLLSLSKFYMTIAGETPIRGYVENKVNSSNCT
jgi:hypothetical protein